jgi:serine/threonine-protein kinase
MELLDGESVDSMAARHGGVLPVNVVLSLADQVLDVLAAAHEKNMVHRDLKPANLFFVRTGELKVLDFGIARLREANLTGPTTSSGVALGTPAFMSPEQALGKDVDAQTDIFALGATMFTLLSGCYLHEAETGQELMVRAATETARSLAAVGVSQPRELVAVVDQALRYAKARRWLDARTMRDAVRALHRSMFESEVSPACVRQLFAQTAVFAKTQLSDALPADPAESATIPQQVLQRLPAGLATTGPPVSAHTEGSAPRGRSGRRPIGRIIWIASGVVTALGLAIGAFVMGQLSRGSPAAAGASDVPTVSVAATASSTQAAPEASSHATASVSPPDAVAESATPLASEVAKPTPTSSVMPASRPRVGPKATLSSAPPFVPPATSTKAAPASSDLWRVK